MKSFEIFIDSSHKGCESNMVSSSVIYKYLLENGHRITKNVQSADFIIINSCGFDKNYTLASITLYKTYHAIKKSEAKIIMFGCLVKIDETRLKPLDLIPISLGDGHLLDELFFQTKKFEEIDPCCDDKIINALFQNHEDADLSLHPNFLLSRFFSLFSRKIKENYNRLLFSLNYTNKILVEISQGCLNNCAYCVIKKAKSNLKSRNIDAIILDIERMYNPSKTLLLVADDCSCYGLDSGTNLFQLVKKINEKFPNITIQINNISPNLLIKFHNHFRELFQEASILYASIPLQSGSNKIIKNMNRHYEVKQASEIIKELKTLSPKTYFEGHFIVGYPGETIVDFIKSLFIIKYFDSPFVLRYSEVEGAKSAMLSQKKSQMTIQMRKLLMNFFINFVVLYRLATNPLNE